MIPVRILLRLLPAMLTALLFAAPANAAWPQRDAAIVVQDGAVQKAAQPSKLADHATKRPHQSASLEEFVGIDHDAEQYLKALLALPAPFVAPVFGGKPLAPSYSCPRRTHRACAPFPTGPPHA
ncbi:MAG TPA: hypothetical protein VEW06_05700 [Xanthobacteraceae bacterium]|jgi:hypothetical protein|nr:hypothetical protein [Xanthobacteraceae bacterium]